MSRIHDIATRVPRRATAGRAVQPMHPTCWTLGVQADLDASFGAIRIVPHPDERAP